MQTAAPNPYAPPRAEGDANDHAVAITEHREVGVLLGAELPPRCAKCGEHATERRAQKGLVGFGLLFWIGLLCAFPMGLIGQRLHWPGGANYPFAVSLAVVFLATVRLERLTVPLCGGCLARWRRLDRWWLVWLGVFLSVSLFLGSIARLLPTPVALALLGAWGLCVLGSALFGAVRFSAAAVVLKRRTGNRLWLEGIHPAAADAWAAQVRPAQRPPHGG